MNHEEQLVIVERKPDQRTALVRLNRPNQLNALNGAVMDALCDALEALAGDQLIVDAMGEELVETFKVIKGAELDRYRAYVTYWEFAEYSPRL